MITNILYKSPLFRMFPLDWQVEGLKYFKNTLIESGILPDDGVVCIRRKLEAVTGHKFVSENEKLCQDLAETLSIYRRRAAQ